MHLSSPLRYTSSSTCLLLSAKCENHIHFCAENGEQVTTNQITNSGFTYDAAGNLTADGTGTGSHTYQWDAENRLKSIDSGSTATYSYNALGRRVEKLVGSTYTEYAYQASGEQFGEHNRTYWTLRAVPFAGRHLAHYQSGAPDATYFLHSAKLGSTSQVTDYTGSVAQDQLYYPWGQEWAMVGSAQEKRFASLGHRDLTETDLDPTHYRMFSSIQGRWLSKDPKYGCGGDPQGLNRYAYARNSPANLIDPMGTCNTYPGTIFEPFARTGCSPFDASCNPCDEDPCSFTCPFADTCGDCGFVGGGGGGQIPVTPDPCAGTVNISYQGPRYIKCPNVTYATTFSVTQGGLTPTHDAPPDWNVKKSNGLTVAYFKDPLNPFILHLGFRATAPLIHQFNIQVWVLWACNGNPVGTALGVPLTCERSKI